jgi:hypothetical protein
LQPLNLSGPKKNAYTSTAPPPYAALDAPFGLDSTPAVAEEWGRQLVTTGRRLTPKEIEDAIEAVGVADIQRVAKKCTFSFSFPFT